ncbi:hypothetical protein FPQ18DRAFT_301182 [Pyronema domesticum]|nr:hypothetical protein FPQ18DRAFT_301182 [Pyronema domesticum]
MPTIGVNHRMTAIMAGKMNARDNRTRNSAKAREMESIKKAEEWKRSQRQFMWKLIGGAVLIVIVVVLCSQGVLGPYLAGCLDFSIAPDPNVYRRQYVYDSTCQHHMFENLWEAVA